MRIHLILIGATLAMTVALVSPAKAALSLEDAVETLSTNLVLPAAVPGVLSAKSCSSCPSRDLQVTASSRYFSGNQPISFSELRRRLGSGRYPVLLALKPDSHIVARIVITGDAYTQ